MTPKEFFKRYPAAQAVWQVGEDLYLEAYEKSARQQAERGGKPCKRITRAEVEETKADKPK